MTFPKINILRALGYIRYVDHKFLSICQGYEGLLSQRKAEFDGTFCGFILQQYLDELCGVGGVGRVVFRSCAPLPRPPRLSLEGYFQCLLISVPAVD